MVAIVVWSVSVALHAITRTLMGFSIVRFAMGVAEAGNWPGATKSNAEWFPIKERALAQGIFNAGASAGALVAAPLVGLFWSWFGWKGTSLVLGALGFLWLAPWLAGSRNSAHRQAHACTYSREPIASNSSNTPRGFNEPLLRESLALRSANRTNGGLRAHSPRPIDTVPPDPAIARAA